MIKLTSDIIEGFVRSCLWEGFDDASEFGDFHREMWDYCTRSDKYVAIAAPRGHSKSTSITLCYTLATLLFRERSYVVIVSDTEAQAVMFLGQIKQQLQENETIIKLFNIKKNEKNLVQFDKDSETDCIVRFTDNTKFRIMAKGSEQKLRGMLWDGKRPDLIVVDDCENEELVMNKDRREKFRRWFQGALLPSMSSGGKIRMVGTILHMDSWLERLMPVETSKNTVVEDLKSYAISGKSASGWLSVKYKAHNPDMSKILWPARWNKQEFIDKKEMYVSQGLSDVYHQEYLNMPIDESRAHFKRADFHPQRKEDLKKHKNYYVTADLAISQKDRADYSVFIVGGVDENNILHIENVIRDRMDGNEIVETILKLQTIYKPMVFGIEEGQISKSIGPFLRERMIAENTIANIYPLKPHKQDKLTRSYSIQARMRMSGVRFDKEADWYPVLEEEMCRFPRDKHDDQVDCMSYLGLLLDLFVEGKTEKEVKEDSYDEIQEETYEPIGRSQLTGY